MIRNDVLFLLGPSKLFSFKFSYFLYLIAFFLEPVVGLLIDFLKVLHVLLPLRLCVVVYFEGPLRPQEVWVRVVVVVSRYLLSIQSQSNQLFYVYRCLVRALQILTEGSGLHILLVEQL